MWQPSFGLAERPYVDALLTHLGVAVFLKDLLRDLEAPRLGQHRLLWRRMRLDSRSDVHSFGRRRVPQAPRRGCHVLERLGVPPVLHRLALQGPGLHDLVVLRDEAVGVRAPVVADEEAGEETRTHVPLLVVLRPLRRLLPQHTFAESVYL